VRAGWIRWKRCVTDSPLGNATITRLRYCVVAFDFDGTLVDSARCISTSLERALIECDCACDVSDVRSQIGLPLQVIIRHASAGIENERIDAVIAAYRRHYAALEHELIVLFPGARETVEQLRAAGIRLAIATNKLTQRAEQTLERLGLLESFDAIVGSEQVAQPKPHPDILLRVLALTGQSAHSALMVGDTIWDLEMAARAGVAACAVTWGNQDRTLLITAEPAHLIDTFPALLEIVQSVEG
jgi:phosphoglycolate phosphatase